MLIADWCGPICLVLIETKLPNEMTSDELKQRTRTFALRIMHLTESLPNTSAANHISHQLLRCGTSVGANYRAACRARSRPDFISKLGIVEEEADEAIYWMELLIDVGLVRRLSIADLMKEADEIVSMIVASIKTVKSRVIANPQSAIRNQKSRA